MALTGNITTDTTELVNTYYDKVALKHEKPFCILDQFAVKSKNIPKYAGDDVQWWKPIPLDVSVSALTEGSSPAATDLEFQNVKAAVAIHGKVVAVSEFLGLTSIDPELKSKAETLGIHRGKYVDMMYWECLAENLYPMRIDADSTYEVATVVTTSASNSTDDIVADGLTQAADHWLGGVFVATSGPNKGMGGYVSDFTATNNIVVLSATAPSYVLNEAMAENQTFKIGASTGITSADPLTCAGVSKAVSILLANHAQPYSDGYYIGVLSPFTQYDIRNDSAFVNADHYAGSKKLYNGEVGSWGGVRFVMDTTPWRSTAGTMGTYVATGAVFHTPIFGQECYAGVGIEGVNSHLIFHNKKQTGDNLEMYSTAGWKAHLVCKVLNATWGIQLLSGATTVS